MIEITEAAQSHFRKLIERAGLPGLGVRLSARDPGTPRADVRLEFAEPADLGGDEWAVDCEGFTLWLDAPSVPFRWLDTRLRWSAEMNGGTGGAPLYQGQVMTLQIAGQRSIPEDAKAVSINLTAVDGFGGGFLTAYPCGGPRPITSNVNHGASSAVANGAIVSLSSSGQLCLFSLIPVNAIMDVNGWWG